MKHREADRPAEPSIGKCQLRGIPKYDFDVSVGVTGLQPCGEIGIDFDACQLGEQFGKYIGGGSIAGTNLKHVVA